MKPESDFTTPRTLMAPISRHFLPVEHPDPFRCTTGLKKGSRLPFIAHFFSSGLGLGASPVFTGALATGVGAGLAATTVVLACCLGSCLAGVTGLAAGAFASATFAMETGFATGALASATFAAGFADATRAFAAGAGTFLATVDPASCACRISTNLPAGPGATSNAIGFSRSTTTLVVGGVLPSMPMRTPFTPPLPTGILFCALATTVSGKVTTTRAGELILLTFGVTAWLELISIWMSSLPGTTFTRSSLLLAEEETGFAAGSAAKAAGLAAGIAAGLTAGAGAPGVGLAPVVPEACCCCSDFTVLRALSIASGLWPKATPAIIAITTMPVVSFISVPTSSPPAFRVLLRRPQKVSNRD